MDENTLEQHRHQIITANTFGFAVYISYLYCSFEFFSQKRIGSYRMLKACGNGNPAQRDVSTEQNVTRETYQYLVGNPLLYGIFL